MKNAFAKKVFCIIICFTIIIMEISLNKTVYEVNAASKIRMSLKQITIISGTYKRIKLKGLTKEQSKKIKWSSSNNKIVSVNRNGRVKGKKAGKAYIYAKYKGRKYKCKVIVKYNCNSKLSASSHKIKVELGKTATVLIKTDRGFGVTCWSDDEDYIINSEWGDWNDDNSVPLKIKGLELGTAKISVYDTKNDDLEIIIKVEVVQPSLTISTQTCPFYIEEYKYYENINYYDYIKRYEIKNITIDKKYDRYDNEYDVNIKLTLSILNDKAGDRKYTYKIYDSNNIIIKTGTGYFDSVPKIGETFNEELNTTFSLKPGTYRLVIE